MTDLDYAARYPVKFSP